MDSIFYVVDKFSNMTIFIYCNKSNDATKIVDLFFKENFQLYGISKSIMLDFKLVFFRDYKEK